MLWLFIVYVLILLLHFSRSHSSQQQRHSSSPYLNSRQRSTSESEPHPQPPPRTKTSKAKLKKASTELQAVKLNRSMSESNVIASLRYGRSDDDNDMEVSTKSLDLRGQRNTVFRLSVIDSDCCAYSLINMRQLQSLFNQSKTWHQIVCWFSWISLFLPVLAWSCS